LQTALLLTSAAMAVSGVLYLMGTRTLGADTQRVLDTVAEREALHAAVRQEAS
jgi:hypothetical protein